MANTTVGPGNSPANNTDVTSGNSLEVQSGGTANTTTVESGGTLTVDPGGTETGALIKAGGTETVTGTINASNVVTSPATASGDDIFGTVNVGSGGTIGSMAAPITVENGGALNLTTKSASANYVTVDTGGLLTINGNAPANNVTLQGGTLELISPKADTTNSTAGVPTASGALTFAAGFQSKLQIDVAQTGTNQTTFAQMIAGYASGDLIELKALTAAGATVTTAASGSSLNVTVTGGNASGSETFAFANTAASSVFTTGADSNGGLDLIETPCYVSGTLIRTVDGDVAVEALRVGDVVVTASGAHRPIRWLGHRRVDCRSHKRPAEVMPVRIVAGAFGAGKPQRDLWLSPGHAICIDILGEVLVPAIALVNGATVAQVQIEEVTYWHVELDSHDILLAENVAAESYIDVDNRGFFVESGTIVLDASPDSPASSWPDTPAGYCRRLVAGGPLVTVLRGQLRARAIALGWRLREVPLADLHLMVDGRRIDAETNGLSARFVVPAKALDIRLMSETSMPWHIGDSPDTRLLGLSLGSISIDDDMAPRRAIALDDPSLDIGFHGHEASSRWTNGEAHLSAAIGASERDRPTILYIELAAPALRHWQPPVRVSETTDSALRA